MTESKGLLITIEGIEGVGKSTAAKVIARFLKDKGVDLILTREPGGTDTAEQIREVLLKHHEDEMCAMTELLLMFATRMQNIEHVIKPALVQGQWVLSDRFTDASFAYQGGGRSLAMQHIAALQDMVQNSLAIECTFLLDAPIEVAMARLHGRTRDRIELEGQRFFARVRDVYLQRAAAEPNRFIVIDASRSLAEVTQDILTHCQQRFAAQLGV